MGTAYASPRTVRRYSFVAVADVTEPNTQSCLHGRISELSRKGCYVDTLNPLPLGTQLKIVVTRDEGTFSASGKVIYVQETFGMGVAFLDVDAEQLKILDAWLADRPHLGAK
jgi:PilZ domain-containing protein